MDFTDKKIWDLVPADIDYIYNNLHMNNYLYAALNYYWKSPIPLNRIIKLKKEHLPEALHAPASSLIELSPYLGNEDPKVVRINYTYYSFQLLSRLKHIRPEELNHVMHFLAAIAYIPIIAEKNDNLLLWLLSMQRKPKEREKHLFNAILNARETAKLASFLGDSLFSHEKPEDTDTPLTIAFLVPMRLVQCIIIMCENSRDKAELQTAWLAVDKLLSCHEKEHGLSGSMYRGNIKHPGQLRYRNTLYLYGGDFFRRCGENRQAWDWYTRDIFFEELPTLFGFYLTDMKTIERLICAYGLIKNKADASAQFLKRLIENCLLQMFCNATTYSTNILSFLAGNPDTDLSLCRIPDGKGYKLYAGEASREIFLMALLYNMVVNNMDCTNMDFNEFFDY